MKLSLPCVCWPCCWPVPSLLPRTRSITSAMLLACCRKYCVACHDAEEPESGLVLESYAALLKAASTDRPSSPGDSRHSRLVLMLDGRAKPAMPPKDNEAPTADEIALLTLDRCRRQGPDGAAARSHRCSSRPRSSRPWPVRPTITAAAISPDGKLLAIGRLWRGRLLTSDEPARWCASLTGFAAGSRAWPSAPTARGWSPPAASRAWSAKPGCGTWPTAACCRTFVGHHDSLYAAALSPDGKLLATGSYDQQIKLWDAQTGKELRTLTGHNDAIFDLAFHPDGKILASASADRTVKLWDVASGQRLDTFSQPLKEFTPWPSAPTASLSPPAASTIGSASGSSARRQGKHQSARRTPASPTKGRCSSWPSRTTASCWPARAKTGQVKLWETANYTERAVLASSSPIGPPAWRSMPMARGCWPAAPMARSNSTDTATGQPRAAAEAGAGHARAPRQSSAAWPRRVKLHRPATWPASPAAKLTGPQGHDRRDQAARSAGRSAGRPLGRDRRARRHAARGMYTLSLTGSGGNGGRSPSMSTICRSAASRSRTTSRASLAEQSLPAAIWGDDQPGRRPRSRPLPRQGGPDHRARTSTPPASARRSMPRSACLIRPAKSSPTTTTSTAARIPLVAYRLPTDGVYTVRVQDQLLSGSQSIFIGCRRASCRW